MGRKLKGGGNAGRKISLNDDQITTLFNEGKTSIEIAVIVGCSSHPIKQALKRLGLHRPAKQRNGILAGERNPAWDGGRHARTDGYIRVWTPNGQRLEHQLVAEKVIGRTLKLGEVVHHKDGNKANNDPSNLEVTTQSEHIREHLADMHAARYNK